MRGFAEQPTRVETGDWDMDQNRAVSRNSWLHQAVVSENYFETPLGDERRKPRILKGPMSRDYRNESEHSNHRGPFLVKGSRVREFYEEASHAREVCYVITKAG